MPNHVMNQLRLSGNQKRINELLESVKSKESVLDFSKIIPMPSSNLCVRRVLAALWACSRNILLRNRWILRREAARIKG